MKERWERMSQGCVRLGAIALFAMWACSHGPRTPIEAGQPDMHGAEEDVGRPVPAIAASEPTSLRHGDSATGVVVKESTTELHLDVNPCGRRKIVIFRLPYERESAGTTSCGSRNIRLESVTQR